MNILDTVRSRLHEEKAVLSSLIAQKVLANDFAQLDYRIATQQRKVTNLELELCYQMPPATKDGWRNSWLIKQLCLVSFSAALIGIGVGLVLAVFAAIAWALIPLNQNENN